RYWRADSADISIQGNIAIMYAGAADRLFHRRTALSPTRRSTIDYSLHCCKDSAYHRANMKPKPVREILENPVWYHATGHTGTVLTPTGLTNPCMESSPNKHW